MNRTISVLLACITLLSVISTGGFATASPQDTYLAVTDVTVTPDPPDAGEEFTVTAAVQNLEESDTTYNINRVELRGGADENFTLYDDIAPTGVTRPGEQQSVRLSGSIDDPGTYTLRLHVYGENDEGEQVHLQHETELRVGAERPQLAIDADDPVANTDSQVNVTVANGLSSDLRNVRVSIEGENVTVENPRRVQSELASGEESTLDFTARADSPGVHRFTATLRYATDNGTTRKVIQHAAVDFEPLSKQVSLNAQSVSDGSAVAVTLTNYGNVPIQNVVIRGESPNATLTDAPMNDLNPGESRTVDLNISRFEADGAIPVTATATYEAGTEQGRTNATVELASNPGTIRLTGTEISPQRGAVQLTGSASNVGLTEANSVIVSVVPTEGVEPAQPNKEYFVGTVPASDFVSFDVFADVDRNVSEIPLQVSYLVDGERRTYTVNVEYDFAPDPTRAPSDTASESRSLLSPAVIGGVVAVSIAGIGLFAWRKRRAGT